MHSTAKQLMTNTSVLMVYCWYVYQRCANGILMVYRRYTDGILMVIADIPMVNDGALIVY